MSRPDLIKLLKEKHPKLNKNQLEIIVDNFFKSIENALGKKKSIELRSFGTFFIKEIKEKYSARNPKTGQLRTSAREIKLALTTEPRAAISR